jgi:hypothetical protein
MPAEAKAHGRKEFILEIRLAARSKPLVESRGQHGHWNSLVDGGFDRPSPLA